MKTLLIISLIFMSACSSEYRQRVRAELIRRQEDKTRVVHTECHKSGWGGQDYACNSY